MKIHQAYILFVLTLGYIAGELVHFLVDITSRPMAQDIHYGDSGCIHNATATHSQEICEDRKTQDECNLLNANTSGTPYCTWDYTGLGIQYQILAGPSFIAVFTIAGVILGIAADRYNRVILLAICVAVFSLANFLMGFAEQYWHLVLLRMLLAAGEAGCSPMSAGLISDVFLEASHGVAMGVFNWGVYFGYGLSYPIGNYVTAANVLDLGWRFTYFVCAVPGLIVCLLLLVTIRDPRHSIKKQEKLDSKEPYIIYKETAQIIDNSRSNEQNGNLPNQSTNTESQGKAICNAFLKPSILALMLAASVRHLAGFCWAYNAQLYFQHYFPNTDRGWWLFGSSVVGGSLGVWIGGVLSDRNLIKNGLQARMIVLTASQALATPFAVGVLYLQPPYAFVSLTMAYLFAEMWFGVLFAVLVEIVPYNVRSTAIGVFLFVMNNIGGNLPILVDPLSKAIGFREALTICYPGFYLTSSFLFLITLFVMRREAKSTQRIAEADTHSQTYDTRL